MRLLELQQRLRDLILAIPEFAGANVFIEDKSDFVSRLLATLSKTAKVTGSIASGSGSVADNAEGLVSQPETFQITFFNSYQNASVALLDLIDAAMRGLHLALTAADVPDADLCFRVTGHSAEDASPLQGIAAHSITLECPNTF